MPKNKHSKKKEDTSDSDSGPDDRGPVKKPKLAGQGKGDNDENAWDLGKNRHVKLTEFKGKWYVDIREFYNADGELRPGRKGIMLTMEQWQKFKQIVPELEEAIKKNV